MYEHLQLSEAKIILKRYEEAKTIRAPYEGRWQEICERVLPRYSGTFQTGGTRPAEGANKNARMIDVSGAKALETFGKIMEAMLTPRMQKWQRLRPSIKHLLKERGVANYFDEVTDTLFQHRYAPRANFATVQQENYIGIGALGNGIKFVEAPREKQLKGLRYRALPLGNVYLLNNHHGIADTLFRPLDLTARQFVQCFNLPTDRIPDVVKVELTKQNGPSDSRYFQVIHCVYPRSDYDQERIDYRGMEWASRYVSIDDKEIIREDGYHTWPFPIGRYFSAPGETYARGPADLALGAQKTLNAMKVTMVEHGQRSVAPVFLAHDDGVADDFNYTPGSMNPGGVNAQGNPLVHALPVGNLAVGEKLMEAEKKDIDDIFLVSLFQILVDKPEMTAEQFIGLMQEKGQLLAPAMGRQQTEDLGPCTERELELLGKQGLLPPMPPALKEAQGEYTVEYDSPLARAMKAEEISGFMRTTSFALNVAAQTKNPRHLDRLNFDAALPEIAAAQATPARWIRSDDELAAYRQEQQDAVDTQTAIDAAPAAAQVMKTMQGMNGAATGG